MVENLHYNHNLNRIVISNLHSSLSLQMAVDVNLKFIDEKTTSVMLIFKCVFILLAKNLF